MMMHCCFGYNAILLGQVQLPRVQQKILKVQSRNISYKKYFTCPLKKRKLTLSASRCDKILRGKPIYDEPAAMPRTDPPFHRWEDPTTVWAFFWIGVGLVALFTIIARAIYYLYHNSGEEDSTTPHTDVHSSTTLDDVK